MAITQALAEIRTIGARVAKKQESINPYLCRQEKVKDPLEKDGGSAAFVRKERQAIADLLQRVIVLRIAIQKSNLVATLTVQGKTCTVAEWLVWRRDVAKVQQALVSQIRSGINGLRQTARQRNVQLRDTTASGAFEPEDLVVAVSEKDIAAEAEWLEQVLGELDGALSMMNATTFVEA
jgi:hypothetical protein